MLDRFNNYLLYKKLVGVEIVGDIKSSFEVTVVKTVYRRNKISIAECKTVDSFEKLFDLIDKETPLVINFNGRQVVHKKGIGTVLDDDESILKSSFPNFTISEFYYQKSQVNTANIFFSIVRKEVVNDIISIFEERGIFVLNIVLGPFCLNSIRTYLGSNSTVRGSNYELSYEDNEITAIDFVENRENGTYLIGDESIDSRGLLAYACLVDFYVGASDAVTSIKLDSKENYKYKTYTKKMLLTALVFILLVLSVNCLVFIVYEKMTSEVDQDYILKKEKVVELDSLRKEAQVKRDYLLKNNFVQLSKTSYYVDRLSFLKPKGVWFQDVNIFPQDRTVDPENGEGVTFKTDLITIDGEANDAYQLNSWLEKLRKESWVNTITLNKIKQVESPDITYFTIDILIK